ncbi:MAG: hypothetical protein KDA17_06240 [Candidatus Saccharibacteria bacterium]|nr:hypothetical protein [Candidatus Saccharibacteria bacterium]
MQIFVRYLTTALSREYAKDNVTVQTVIPLYVATNMSRIIRTSFFVPNGALRALF